MKRFVLMYIMILAAVMMQGQNTLLPYPTDTIQDTIVYRYPAPKSIGLYRISKIFEVSQETILRWNPQLQQRGPQLDEVLLIPAGVVQPVQSEAVQPVQPAIVEPVQPDPLPVVTDTVIPIVSEPSPLPVFEPDSSTLRIAVLLPLNARSTERSKDDDRFFDFYAGLLLAVYEAQAAGMSMEIHTYDIPRSDKGLDQVLSDPWMQHAHAVIGPAYTQQVTPVAEWCKANRRWMLIPFTSRVAEIGDNPYLLQFNPSTDAETEVLLHNLRQRSDSIHCVTVDAGRNTTATMQQLHRQIRANGLSAASVTLHDMMVDSADYAMRDSMENILFLHTDKYANARILIPHIMQLAIRHRMTLYIQYSWLKERLTLPVLYTTIFREPDTENEDYQRYESLYAHYFGHTPAVDMPRYDLLGYDLTAHLLTLLRTLSHEDEQSMNATYTGLQTDIHYQPVSEQGGRMNTCIKVVTP